jgi:TRAP-type C4-dicarboxylate transport system substrate-binding protein
MALADRRTVVTGAMAGAATLAAPSFLHAQSPTVLNLSSWLPPASLITQNLFVPWANDINAMTEGRVVVEILPKPLGPPPAHQGLVQSGEADLVYSLHGYTQDAFLRARVGQFSFLGDAYSASHAFSKVYGKLLKADEEHENMTLLGLFQHGPGVLMLKNKTIAGPEDYEGLRIRTSGGYIASLIEDLGASNVPMSPVVVRDALVNGEIDGVAFPYEAGPAFNVMDQITFVSELPGGYYNATWFLAISDQAKAKIDPTDLALIQRYSNETVHVLAAKAFDYADYLAREDFLKRGVPIEPTSSSLTDHIKKLATAYEEEWSAQVAEGGYDGERALAYTRRIAGTK